MVYDRIGTLLSLCKEENHKFPRTDLYNEGWMLRLILDWAHENRGADFNIGIGYSPTSDWYSEALLPSAFLARKRPDHLAESYTHADGAVGHFDIGKKNKGELSLPAGATSFTVIEAKIFSKLSAGVKNAIYFNQAARNVACMAEVIRLAGIPVDSIDYLQFCVLAPQSGIDDGDFGNLVTKDSVRETVNRRVEAYEGEKDCWFEDSFLPLLECVELNLLSWESVIKALRDSDMGYGSQLDEFYSFCLEFNRPYGHSLAR